METTENPTISQIAGDAPTLMAMFDLGRLGYVEREYLIQGTARSFSVVGERTMDGRWSVETAADAPFTSRFLVRVPTNPARFSGTVAVEWHNVSAGMDGGPDWTLLHRDLIARGHGWVGVSAQKAGIDGGGIAEGMHLKKMAPDRYGALEHPGDAWSFDIFTQVARALRLPGPDGPLGGIVPERLIALGESQSAAFLVTYINAVDFQAQVFDAFFVHGRGASGADMEGFRIPRGTDLNDARRALMNKPERIRDDARVPVVVLQSETDVALLGGRLPTQPDGTSLRLWEIAGAAHADTYLLVAGSQDDGSLGSHRMAELLQPTSDLFIGNTDTPINAGPQQHYVGQAAFEALVRWAEGGPPPPAASRLELTEGGLEVDALGIAKGGIRTPWVDVPTAQLSGLGQSGEAFAILFGTTRPFEQATLAGLYPAGANEYLTRFTDSLDRAISSGFILPEDRDEILGLAASSYELVTSRA